jgi:hypothetical protein
MRNGRAPDTKELTRAGVRPLQGAGRVHDEERLVARIEQSGKAGFLEIVLRIKWTRLCHRSCAGE